jgi:hypothetical protein
MWNGKIDEVRIWNVTLRETEIQGNMFNTLNGDENGLVAYYSFDHITGTVLSDLTENSYNGTLQNMTNDDWVTSTAPVGDNGVIVQTQTQTNIGPSGMQMGVTLTSGGDETNYLGIFQSGSGASLINSGETFPDGITQRSDVLWGLQEFGSVTASLVFDYSEISGLDDPSSVMLLKRVDAASAWTNVTGLFEHNTINRTFSGTGFTEFSDYSVGDNGDGALPVELTDFSASFSKSHVVLNWTTQSETENLGWNIFCSENENGYENEDYIQINSELVPGMGTTSQPTDYSFIDENLAVEGHNYYYWLQSVSTTNELEMFDPVSIEIPATNQLPIMTILSKNYPNPFNPETTISFSVKENEKAILAIYNIKGQRILKQTFEAGLHNYIWQADDFASGVYFYKLSSPTTNVTKKMMLMK